VLVVLISSLNSQPNPVLERDNEFLDHNLDPVIPLSYSYFITVVSISLDHPITRSRANQKAPKTVQTERWSDGLAHTHTSPNLLNVLLIRATLYYAYQTDQLNPDHTTVKDERVLGQVRGWAGISDPSLY
jgi:hypothetical protein